MTWLRTIWGLVVGDRSDFAQPDMARVWEMLDYLRDDAYSPPAHCRNDALTH